MAEKKDKIKESEFTKTLKVKLTQEELLQAGEDLAKSLDDMRRIEDEKKALNDNFKAKLAELDAKAVQLQSKVRNKWDYRDVDCIETMNNTKGTVVQTRVDTGEIIEERKMNHHERQSKFWDE